MESVQRIVAHEIMDRMAAHGWVPARNFTNPDEAEIIFDAGSNGGWVTLRVRFGIENCFFLGTSCTFEYADPDFPENLWDVIVKLMDYGVPGSPFECTSEEVLRSVCPNRCRLL